jgi:predicted nucleic acid-binding protein
VITAVDTNVLVDVFRADREHGERSREVLRACLGEGSLVASSVVWTEVATLFEPDPVAAEKALDTLGVVFVPSDRKAALLAAGFWQSYRRRGGESRRIAADFIVGAHALAHADRLLTRDRGFYRDYFEGLVVIDPTA